MWLWWFDRAGTIQSSSLNFIQDFPYFVVLMCILDRFQDADWCMNPVFSACPPLLGTHGGIRPSYQVTLEGPGPERRKLNVTLHPAETPLQLSLFSRGSAVVEATSSDPLPLSPANFLLGGEIVAKVYYPDEIRRSEADILAYAYGIAAQQDIGKHVRGHVPILFAKADWIDPSAAAIEEVLGVTKDHGRRRPRRLRILLFPKLRHIWELSDKRFIKVFFDCFRCKCLP